jgi:hypothetical protein
MNQHLRLLSWALFVLGLLLAPNLAQSAPLKVIKEWSGSIEDEALQKNAPANGVIANAKDLEKLWKAWKLEDKVPEVDFKTQLLAVSTTVGSKLTVSAVLDEKGDLRVLGRATRDLRPGFRYHIVLVPREGVKTVNGKELPAD